MTKRKAGVKADSSKNVLPFMDTFYALSSNESSERTLAASSLLNHVFLPDNKETTENNESVTIKDGYYAFTRLLKGLCSGRASARQGYASCLATFLKFAFNAGPSSQTKFWIDCFIECAMEDTQSMDEDLSPVEFVRSELIRHTSFAASSGDKVEKRTKGGSEERDHIFGKLFGISAIVRSGILVKDSSTSKVIKGFVSDLIILYNHKKWMREPTAHALQELLTFLADGGKMDLLDMLVKAELSDFFDHQKKAWNVEEIAMYLHLQSLYMDNNTALPKKLSQPLLTSSSLAGGKHTILETLRDTSKVVHPRCHLVWSSIWSYLTTPSGSSGTGMKRKGYDSNKGDDYLLALRNRDLRSKLLGDESATDIIKTLVNQLIVGSLLGGHPQKSDGDLPGNQNNCTHERRALALSLVHQLCMLRIPSDLLEEFVLQPTIITKMFVHTLQRQNLGSKMPGKHALKELASHVLNSIVESSISSDDRNVEEPHSLRMTVIRSLVKATPEFDYMTQTETVKKLLTLNSSFDLTRLSSASVLDRKLLWKDFTCFMEKQILTSVRDGSQSLPDIKRNIDLLYSSARLILRDGKESDPEHLFHRILLFFMAGAFFDCTKFKTGKGHKKSSCSGILEVAQLLKSETELPYDARVHLSSRFYSLLSEGVTILPAQKSYLEQRNGFNKTKGMHDTLHFLCLAWETILSHGACSFDKSEEEATNGEENILKIKKVCDEVNGMIQENYEDKPKSKAALGIACLMSSLCLYLLTPGSPDISNEKDFNESEEDYNSEVLEFMLELSRMIEVITGKSLLPSDEDGEETDSNKLETLASICVDILSSPLGGDAFATDSSPRGMASKLLKDCVKAAWSGGLALLKEELSSDEFTLDVNVMKTILNSICGEDALICEGEDGNSDEDMEDESDSEDQDSEDGMGVFTKAASMNVDSEENEDVSMGEKSVPDDANQDDEDVELDPSALENLLLEDSDADSDTEGVLEHHAGADAALAMLIKAKQDARKAGQQKREKIETSYRLRCIVLLESIFSRGSDLSQSVVFSTILPLLRAKRNLDKTIAKMTASLNGVKKLDKSMLTEKRTLSEKISTLLQGKISKFNFHDAPSLEDCSSLSSEIMAELKKGSSPSHNSCCSSLFILLVKAVSQKHSDSIVIAKLIYIDAIKEWSTNKKTRLSPSIFDDFVVRCPRVARAVLMNSTTTAAIEGRSAYVKKASFQLITSLYTGVASSEEDNNPNEADPLNQAAPNVATAIETALNDQGMLQKKYVESVLKCAGKVFSHVKDNDSTVIWEALQKLKAPISSVNDKSENTGIKNMCSNLLTELTIGIDNMEKVKKSSKQQDVGVKKVGSGKKKKKTSKKKKKTSKKR